MTAFLIFGALTAVQIICFFVIKNYFNKREKNLEKTRDFYVTEITNLQAILRASITEFNKQMLEINQWAETFPGQMNEIFYTDTKVRELKNRFKLADTKMFEYFNPVVETVSKEVVKHLVDFLNKIKVRQIDITERIIDERTKSHNASRT